MHSIVIHLDHKQQDWHLVEPFFYKLQSEKELTLFWEEEASASHPLFLSSVERITETLDRERIKDWQLIIIVNLHNDSNRALRLTTKLSEIREKLLMPLRETGIYPLQTILHVVDMMNRNSDYAPKDFLLRKYWELDHYGYFRTKDERPRIGNAFTYDELTVLDEAWGEAIDLQDIVLDHPPKEFMENLQQKCERVKNDLNHLIKRKKDHCVSARNRYISDVWMRPDQLEAVFKDFDHRLKQMVKLPLSSALTSFTPSKELSSSFKYYVGIQGAIGDIRLVRQEVGHRSHRDRIRGYLELTYFLLTICHHPNLIDRMDKGSASVIRLTIDEEKLEKLLNHYYVNLLHVKRQVEDQLLLENQFQTHQFREEEFMPYTAASLEKRSAEPHPFLKRQKINPKYFDKWQDQLNIAEHHLMERDRELRQNSREGINKLNVLKRKNEFVEEDDWIDINDYQQDLLQQIGTMQKDVTYLTPSLSEAIGLWRNHVSEAKKRMHFLLQQIPNGRHLWTCSLLIFMILFLPLMSNATLNGMFYLIPAVVVTFIGFFLTKRAAQKPVWKFQEDTYAYTEKIYHLQVEAQHRYNEYLKHLFRLFSLRKFIDKASLIGEKMKEHNLLFRYHLIKIDEYLQAANRLLHILQFSTDRTAHQEIKGPVVKYEKSIIDNHVYSPFQQSGLLVENGYRIEVYLGSAREQYQSAYINEIDKIRIQEDKVYKIWN